jgi:hypothetical protein
VSDITLRRAAEQAREALRFFDGASMPPEVRQPLTKTLAALDAALAEPELQKERPDFLAGYDAGLADGRRCAERDAQDARDAAIVAAALAEPEQGNCADGSCGCCWTDKPDAKSEPVAKAWAEGYQQGVQDERTSEASIGIAGFGAKVEPARQNPYAALPAPQPEAKREPATEKQVLAEFDGDETCTWVYEFEAGFRAAERFHGIVKEGGK